MPGDVKRGHDVFFGNTAACAKCHKFNGEGKDVGPDLTAIRTKFQKPEVLDSVLNPSAAIAFGYEAWIVKTKKNDVYSGFIIADGEIITLKESSGEQRTIAAKDIVLRKKQTMSIMPDNVALGLTAQELSDLAEYLLKAPVTLPATPKPGAVNLLPLPGTPGEGRGEGRATLANIVRSTPRALCPSPPPSPRKRTRGEGERCSNAHTNGRDHAIPPSPQPASHRRDGGA
jgi:putative heme-binding domain-containing protein